MKFLNFILKILGNIVGIIIVIYTIFLYLDFTLKVSLSKNNIKKMIYDIDLIDDSKTIFKTEDRIIERTINDVKIGNLTYEDKKEILYKSKLYNNVQNYLTNNVYYFIGYSKEKALFNEKDKISSKNDLVKLISKKTTMTNDEKLKLYSEIDKVYSCLEDVDIKALTSEIPEEYTIIIDYINNKEIIIIEIIIMVVFIVANALLLRKISKPFKWLAIGLLFSTIISVILRIALSTLDINNIFLNKIKLYVLDTVEISFIYSMVLLVTCTIGYFVLESKKNEKVSNI